jgi:hypothetical protein
MKRNRAWLVLFFTILVILSLPVGVPAQEITPGSPTEYLAPMRDGVKLAASVYLPEGDGPWPVVLMRTPYNKAGRGASVDRYTKEGYAYVIQDQRGRFASEGAYRPHENELHDGYDTVAWAASQPWSNGKVGMTGASAMGIAANLAASTNPPNLVCAYVRIAPQSLFYEGRFVGGVFKEADSGGWMRGQGIGEAEIARYRKRVVLDERWRSTDFIFHRHRVDIPIYNAGGWYDLFVHGNVTNFQYLQNWGREGALGNQKLMMGPIGHGPLQGDIAYPDSDVATDEEVRFFDYWLKGVENGIMDEPPVKYYMMASARKGNASSKNGWRTADAWPPNGSRRVRFYLHEGGGLSADTPMIERSSTRYRVDPANPVKTYGGLNLRLPIGPMDQREVGEREDYLRYQTQPLEADLVLAGKIDLDLFASTDGPDTDFMVKLVDVYPDGYEALILDTALQTRFRKGRRPEMVKLMTPGKIERMNVDLWHSAITIEKGHRLAVHIASSNSPRFSVNPNTGEAPGKNQSPPRIANNVIHHDFSRPTAIILPVFSR